MHSSSSNISLSGITTVKQKLYFTSGNKQLELWPVTANIFRVRYTTEYFAKDFSYALRPGMEEFIETVQYDLRHPLYYSVYSTKLECRINKETLNVTFLNEKGEIINEDLDGYNAEPNKGYGGFYIFCSKKIQQGEYFTGLGDKATHLNLRGKRFLNWGSDTFAFAKEQDPLYRNIPFYYGLQNNLAYGVFFDNSFQTFFDFGHDRPDQCRFWAEGGEMSYYFIYGPQLMQVAEHYAQLTGVAELPPLWALGYHQSKWSYSPEERVREVAALLRTKKIPCDVIHLDIEYMQDYKVFTWKEERFPSPKKLIEELKANGFNVVTIFDPGIKIEKYYQPYEEGIQQNLFCKRQDGDIFRGKVWPGECHFPDFTSPDVREWWSNHIACFLQSGIQGCWNDMNEPVVFEIGTMPDDVRHNFDGLDVSHRRAHNVYGMLMSRATYEGMKKQNAAQRPFNLSRTGFAGIQRYAAIWTGDNVTSWDHLWLAAIQCQRLSISGVSFCGTDIGGFLDKPDPEISIRFFQLGIFHPFFRCHFSHEHGEKEPWSFGSAYETLIRKAIEFRYRLLPYLYTAMWQHSHKGTPVIRPLSFYDQQDEECLIRTEEFLCGDHLLTAPITEKGVSSRKMYLPKGKWFNFFTNKKVDGGEEIRAEAELDRFPLFVRAGAVIPLQAVKQYVNEKNDEPLTLQIYFSENRVASYLYEDAGDGYEYLNGKCSLKKFTVFGNRKQFRIIQDKQWNFKTAYTHYKLVIAGLPFKADAIIVDGKKPSSLKGKSKVVDFLVPANFKKIVIA